MLFCTDIDFTEQPLSSLDRDVYKIFIIGILQFGTYEAELRCVMARVQY